MTCCSPSRGHSRVPTSRTDVNNVMDSKLVTAQGGDVCRPSRGEIRLSFRNAELLVWNFEETTDAFFSGSKFGSVMEQLGSCGSSFKNRGLDD
ncbi:unnamed protein product [Boreogadus saida]